MRLKVTIHSISRKNVSFSVNSRNHTLTMMHRVMTQPRGSLARGKPSLAVVMVYPPSPLHYHLFELPWPGLAPLVLPWRSQ